MKATLLATQQSIMDNIEFIFGFIAVFLLPQMTAFIAIGLLVMIDMFTGVCCALKVKTQITSKRMKDTVIKLIMYNVFIITCMITESFLLTRIPFIEVALGIIATVETKSIFENIENILDIKIIRAFKEIMHKSRNTKKSD